MAAARPFGPEPTTTASNSMGSLYGDHDNFRLLCRTEWGAIRQPMISEQELFSKITRRLIPFMFLLYIVSYLDRINVGFAALQLNEALHFDPAVFGLGAGIF